MLQVVWHENLFHLLYYMLNSRYSHHSPFLETTLTHGSQLRERGSTGGYRFQGGAWKSLSLGQSPDSLAQQGNRLAAAAVPTQPCILAYGLRLPKRTQKDSSVTPDTSRNHVNLRNSKSPFQEVPA